jgi:phage/plasmid-associated DNA primase
MTTDNTDANDILRERGPDGLRSTIDETPTELLPPVEQGDERDARSPAFSDDALALRFVDRHASELRYVAVWAKWLRWDRKRWAFDETLHVFDLVRHVCREAASECNEPKASKAIASAATVAAVERLARADRRIAATVDQWDADPWLLNTPDSVVDLRSGQMRRHRAEDCMTKITAVGRATTVRSFSRSSKRSRAPIRRRFHLIPFAVTIPVKDRNPDLADKLKAEWPGILRWMIEGCLKWQQTGLRPPQAVIEATQAYLLAEDATAAWLDDCCVLDPNARASSGELFASYKAWAEGTGEYVGTEKSFSQKLEERGFERYRSNSARGFRGLRVNREHDVVPDRDGDP